MAIYVPQWFVTSSVAALVVGLFIIANLYAVPVSVAIPLLSTVFETVFRNVVTVHQSPALYWVTWPVMLVEQRGCSSD